MSETKTPKQTNQVVDRPPNGLTGIPQRIHCVATQDRVGSENELDRMMIDNFLHTLGEIAISIASREHEDVEDVEV